MLEPAELSLDRSAPSRGYLFKMPAAVVRSFRSLAAVAPRPTPEGTPRSPRADAAIGKLVVTG